MQTVYYPMLNSIQKKEIHWGNKGLRNSKIQPVIAKKNSISCYVRKYLKDLLLCAQISKLIDSLIKPYIPQTNTLQSNYQFLDHLTTF